MTIKTDPENLKYPIGKFQSPATYSDKGLDKWITRIANFPFDLFNLTSTLSETELSWAYRPEGWSIRQLVNHCADSHMNSFIRFKWALTEDSPTIKAYDEGAWAMLSDSTKGSIMPTLTFLDGLHERWVYLLKNLREEEWRNEFIHPESGKAISLWQNAALYSWHCQHHFTHIQLALEFEGKYRQIRA